MSRLQLPHRELVSARTVAATATHDRRAFRLHLIQHHNYGYDEAREAYPDAE